MSGPDSFNPGISSGGIVYCAAVQTNGSVLIGGKFQAPLGDFQGANIARANASGSLDTNFSPEADNTVSALALQTNGQILVGGAFAHLCNQSRLSIGRLNSDGSLDTNFDPSANGTVSSMALLTNGQILVGGSFTTLDGQSCTNIGRLNSNGTRDTTFTPHSVVGSVSSIALQTNGQIVVGGWFELDGQSWKGIARLNSNGTVDTNFTPPNTGPVLALDLQADNKILTGESGCCQRLSTNGTTDTSFTQIDCGSDIDALAVQTDGKILVGGSFYVTGSPSYFNRLNSDGTLDSFFSPTANGQVYSLAMQSNGDIIVGGSFTTLGGQSRVGIGRLTPTILATQSVAFDGSTITWSRGGSSPEVWSTTFDGSTNGATWTPLGAGTRITGGWQFGGLAWPTNANLRARGFITSGEGDGSAWYIETDVEPPIITNQPSSQTVVAGGNVTFSVGACSFAPPLSYQWQFNGTAIAGATNPTLVLTDVQSTQAGNYSVVVANAYGSAGATAVLTVLPIPSFSNLSPSRAITNGTPTVALAGTLSASGPVYPPLGETIAITIDGNQQTTTINDSTGDFSLNYNSSAIPVGGYIISYSYAGDASFGPASNTITVLTVLTKPSYIALGTNGSTSVTNFTFQGDTTYYVSAPVTLYGTATFEGGAVIKYATNASLTLNYPAAANFVGANYHPTVFTAKDDNSVGAVISGSTGNPSGYYANPAILYNGAANTSSSLAVQHFRISYAEEAINASGVSITIQLNDGQIVDCYYGFYTAGQAAVTIENMLFDTFNVALTLGIANASIENTTFYGDIYGCCGTMLEALGAGGSTFSYFRNCIVANVISFSPPMPHMPGGDHNGFYNSGAACTYWYTNKWFGTSVVTNATTPFQIVGGGGFYLTNGCGFASAGTTNISSALLADLQDKTVYAPVTNIYGWLTNNYTFSPQVQRDTNVSTVALGYHYDPLDYAMAVGISNATATVLPGTALGAMGQSNGVQLYSAATFNCDGTADSPNYITRYNTVQEQSNTNWETTNWLGSFQTSGGNGTLPSTANFTYTGWSVMGEDAQLVTSPGDASLLTFENCQLYSGQLYDVGPTILATNNLFQRVDTWLEDFAAVNAVSNAFYNNLFLDGELSLDHNIGGGSGLWTFRDNLFDQATISSFLSTPTVDSSSNNAYVTTNFGLVLPSNDDVILSSSPAFQIGDLGDYYYPTNLPLINAGSRSAATAGLYYYTVTTNNAIEGTNTVSIGFHYLGTNF
jgi:uncharacterized delta-60 repeat protein